VRKLMVLALPIAAVAVFALPAISSAQEIHWTNTAQFTGSAGPGLFAINEGPNITCERGDVVGTPSAGGTTGVISLDFTGCHITIGPWTFKCHTPGSALDNTIKYEATYHLTTAGSKPGMLVTFQLFAVFCASVPQFVLTGNVIGTLVSPACGGESKEMSTSFAATGSTQNHLEYTGIKYDLTAETEGSGKPQTSGLTTTWTTQQAAAGKLECT